MNSIRFTDLDTDVLEFEDSSDNDLMVRMTDHAGSKLVLLESEQVDALAKFLATRAITSPRENYIVRYDV